MKKIKIHLGPPKTGTTTIQNALKSHLPDNYINGNSKLSEIIISFIHGNNSTDLNEIQNKIRKLLKKQDFLIYSDERVLIEYSKKNDWVLQLHKLFQVFNLQETEIEVIIFIRNPMESIPSLYQQMLNVNWVSKLPLEKFMLTMQAKIFNYDFLERKIFEAGFTNINYQRFEILHDKELDLTCFGFNNHIQLNGIKNQSRADNKNRIYIYTAADVVRRNFAMVKFLLPIKLRIEIAKKLNFKIREEKIRKDVLVPKEYMEAYKNKISI